MGLGHALAVIALSGCPLLAAGPCVGSSPDLDGWLAFWQGKLHFSDWKISVKAARQSEIPRLAGTIDWDRKSKRANIEVLEEADWKYGSYDCRNSFALVDILSEMEETVIHELVHLTLAPLNITGTNAEESVVNSISGALENKVIPGHMHHPEHEASTYEIHWFVESKISRLCRLKPVDQKAKADAVQRLAGVFIEIHPRTVGVP